MRMVISDVLRLNTVSDAIPSLYRPPLSIYSAPDAARCPDVRTIDKWPAYKNRVGLLTKALGLRSGKLLSLD